MKIIVTAEEIMDKGSWEKFCEEFGINLWAMNEGLMDDDDEFTLTEKQARSFGFLRVKEEATWY
jgi:hypothetical protein